MTHNPREIEELRSILRTPTCTSHRRWEHRDLSELLSPDGLTLKSALPFYASPLQLVTLITRPTQVGEAFSPKQYDRSPVKCDNTLAGALEMRRTLSLHHMDGDDEDDEGNDPSPPRSPTPFSLHRFPSFGEVATIDSDDESETDSPTQLRRFLPSVVPARGGDEEKNEGTAEVDCAGSVGSPSFRVCGQTSIDSDSDSDLESPPDTNPGQEITTTSPRQPLRLLNVGPATPLTPVTPLGEVKPKPSRRPRSRNLSMTSHFSGFSSVDEFGFSEGVLGGF